MYIIQNKFRVFYVDKCKLGEHHTFLYMLVWTDITQHSWASRDFWTPFFGPNWNTNHQQKLCSDRLFGLQGVTLVFVQKASLTSLTDAPLIQKSFLVSGKK